MAGLVTGMPTLLELEARDRMRLRGNGVHRTLVSGVGLLLLAMIVALIGTIIVRGVGAIDWEFLSQPPTDGMTAGGIWPMIRGSLLLMAGSFGLALPVGVLGGVFLAEYAGRSRWAHAVRSGVTSLAGTPSIIYGLFGMAVFVLMLDFGVSLLAGWLTLATMSLPLIVLTTDHAIRSVPDAIVDGAIALGLTRTQAMFRVVLPRALPGILTGVVLATSRAAGEAPPILLTAGIYYSTVTPRLSLDTLKQPVANLPYHLAEAYRQSAVIPAKIVWGTCLVLMGLVLLVNLAAILIRVRYRTRNNT